MEDFRKQEFQNSLDLTSEELERYVPELLKGLWELGSMPEYMIELYSRNNLGNGKNILDLGCGKGAVLIKLAKQFDIKAIGVDVVSEFIEEAKQYAKKHGVADKVVFKAEDIIETLKNTPRQDIVIYGFDSDLFGDLNDTLRELSFCVREGGFILLEFMFTEQVNADLMTNREMTSTIEQAGYRIVDRMDWSRETLRKANIQNTEVIRGNVHRLISLYPDKEEIFREYLQNQIDECEELENDYTCTTLLLGHKNT